MASKNIFISNPGNIKDTDTINEAGGKAYALSDEAALCQYVLTGTFNNTFYASDTDQLTKVLGLANKCNVEFVARLAVYAREVGLMKDMPAFLTAVVANKNSVLLKKIFPLVINDIKMLRNFVQIIRSGVVGRKSLGTAPKRLIQKFLSNRSDEQLFKDNIGNDPSLSDVIKMVHPKASSPERNSLYGYFIGKEHDKTVLHPLVKAFEAFKQDMTLAIPNVPFQMLTALPLTEDNWKSIARNATWNQIRQNLNTFARHNVFNDQDLVKLIADKLQNENEVKRSRTFPYQLFATFLNVDENVPVQIKIAIQKAGEIAIENVPSVDGKVIIALDVSGSMRDPVTGHRGSATSKIKCIDVASMFAASIIRKNPLAKVIPFDTTIKNVEINPLDTVMSNSQKLAAHGVNGGTDCGVVLAHLNENNVNADVVVMISDNQSWVQSNKTYKGESSMMREWSKFHHNNKNSKLVCMDIAPYGNTQAYGTGEVLNIGGFSDQTFAVVSDFIKGKGRDMLVKIVESIELNNDLSKKESLWDVKPDNAIK